ncbi:hypothetical protein EYF80_014988 [Liparis tanakae]|uniref:Uncharacterized protein n=1 Tax=Liparis tanakae TaxID=230148 RepID=A0A4Z2IA77_9TELE|nr:hypothetical protein EYF80_014988 [Liparis tanakae]
MWLPAEVNDGLRFDWQPVVTQQGLQEVAAAGGEDGPVCAHFPALHQHGHIAQDALPSLLLQVQQHVGTVDLGLIHNQGQTRRYSDSHLSRYKWYYKTAGRPGLTSLSLRLLWGSVNRIGLVRFQGDFLFAPLRDAYRQNDVPRLNEARCGCRGVLPAARIDQLGDQLGAH